MKKNILLVLSISIILIATYLILIRRAEEGNQSLSPIENKEGQDKKELSQKTYFSNEYFFKIDYPENVDYSLLNQNKTVSFSLKEYGNQKRKAFSFVVNNYSLDEYGVSVKDWWEEYGPQNERQAPYPDEEKEIKIGNLDAYYTSYETSRTSFGYDYFTPVFIYIIHDGKVFEISGVKLPSDAKDLGFSDQEIQEAKSYESIFNQMLESFTFTK